ncbi:MAG: MalY/PatB family protein [Gammaproteobacteria bacterium]
MSVDFDREIDREQTNSVKFDARRAVFGSADVIPLWVADMDFAAPPAVTEALAERARHPVYGYSLFPESLHDALIDWFRVRHNWAIQREWILMAPGVVPSLHAAALAFAAPGEGIIVQPPVYPPFFTAVAKTGRRVIENPLVVQDSEYCMDLAHLEQCARDGAKVLLLCSPHNPVGRVWREDELQALLAIARRHRLLVLSDDIHADLVYPGQRHRMLATLAGADDAVITAIAPSKSFNIPGLGLSALVVPDAAQRAALKRVFESVHMEQANPFSIVAFEAAYRHGGPWLDGLLAYLQGNLGFTRDFLARHVPEIRPLAPEGTYLLWLDCRALGLDDEALRAFFVQQAGLGLNPGVSFGTGGNGHMRLNLGTRRALLQQALAQLHTAVRQLAASR